MSSQWESHHIGSAEHSAWLWDELNKPDIVDLRPASVRMHDAYKGSKQQKHDAKVATAACLVKTAVGGCYSGALAGVATGGFTGNPVKGCVEGAINEVSKAVVSGSCNFTNHTNGAGRGTFFDPK